MIETPLISVIIPVYNTDRFVAQAIQSVLDQTYSNWELIIVDDGSTDSSSKIISSFRDKRISFLTQTRNGVSAARNLAIESAKGEFLAFLDSDDWLPRNSLASRLEVFRNNEHCDFVDGQVQVYSELGDQLKKSWLPTLRGNPQSSLVRLSEKCFFGPSWMIKKKSSKSYKFDPTVTHGEELLFYISISDKGIYDFTSSVIYCYRDRAGSAMKDCDNLGGSYIVLRNRIFNNNKFNFLSRIIFEFRIKRIMMLSYIRAGKFIQALRYIIK